jgi:hypothetical protein
MNSINFLKQAELADKLGNFRLADQLYHRAVRTVTANKALLEALEKAGIKAGEKATFGTAARALLDSLGAAMTKKESVELRLILKEAGVTDEMIEKIVKDAVENGKAPEAEFVKRIAQDLEKNLNSSTSIFERMKPSFSNKIQEVGSKISEGTKKRIDALMKNPGAMKMLKAAGIIAMVGGAGWYFVSVNGDPVSDEEVENALTGSEMYDLRMQAGQQQTQNEKAQAYVDANKGKFTSQRDFYNAALGAGDKNFANSVIAIVKKDLDLPIEPSSSSPKESGSNLNKAPYSAS